MPERSAEIELSEREIRILHAALDYFVNTSEWPPIRYLSVAIAEKSEIKEGENGEKTGVSIGQIEEVYLKNLKDLGFWQKGERVKSIGRLTISGIEEALRSGYKPAEDALLYKMFEVIVSSSK